MTALAPVIDIPISEAKIRRAIMDQEPSVLADIYREEINIAIWQRRLSEELFSAASQLLEKRSLQLSVTVSPKNTYEALKGAFGTEKHFELLASDIAELVEMFSCLFDLKSVGLRLSSLGHAMCPRFHVDNIPCRLVTTYHGEATQWLAHDRVDRSKLGPLSKGAPDEQSGLFSNVSDIQQLKQGEIALLKGEGWIGNETAGLVHRSPQLQGGGKRLLLTLDMIY